MQIGVCVCIGVCMCVSLNLYVGMHVNICTVVYKIDDSILSMLFDSMCIHVCGFIC